jgi:transposase
MKRKRPGGGGCEINGGNRPGTWRTYGIGVDTHSEFIVVTVLVPVYTQQVEKRYQRHFSTATPDLIRAREWAVEVMKPHLGTCIPTRTDMHYTIESTACYHFPVVRAWGGQPAIVNPNLIKAGQRKTDDIDSLQLAEMDLNKKWPLSYVFPDDQQAIRVLLRLHHRHSRQETMWGKTLSSQLLKFGVSLARLGSLRSSKVRPHVEDYLAGRGLILPEAQECLPTDPPPAWLGQHLLPLLDYVDVSHERAKALDKVINETLKTVKYRCGGGMVPGPEAVGWVQTIPGIGSQTGRWLVAEIGDIHRFYSSNALCAWAGCDMSLRISAGKVTAFTRRKGHKHIHWLLTQAGHRAACGKTVLGQWAQARMKKGGKGCVQRTIGAVAHRICEGVYHVLMRGEAWKPSFRVEVDDVREEGAGERQGAKHRKGA